MFVFWKDKLKDRGIFPTVLCEAWRRSHSTGVRCWGATLWGRLVSLAAKQMLSSCQMNSCLQDKYSIWGQTRVTWEILRCIETLPKSNLYTGGKRVSWQCHLMYGYHLQTLLRVWHLSHLCQMFTRVLMMCSPSLVEKISTSSLRSLTDCRYLLLGHRVSLMTGSRWWRRGQLLMPHLCSAVRAQSSLWTAY